MGVVWKNQDLFEGCMSKIIMGIVLLVIVGIGLLINYLGMDERLAIGIPFVLVIIAFIGWIIIKEVKK